MKQPTILLVAFAMMLGTGCASVLEGALQGQTEDEMEAGLRNLVGKPAQVAFARLGYPDQSMKVAGDEVYTWSRVRSLEGYEPRQQTVQGFCNGVPCSATVNTTTKVSDERQCMVRLIAGPDGILNRWEWRGTWPASKEFTKALRVEAQ